MYLPASPNGASSEVAALHGFAPRTRQPRRIAEQVELDRLRRCDLAPAQLWARLLNDGVYL